jgi:hypothetical protein
MNFILIKGIYISKLSIFVEKLSILLVFVSGLLQIHLGSGAAQIRIRILLKLSDPTASVSGSTTLATGGRYFKTGDARKV